MKRLLLIASVIVFASYSIWLKLGLRGDADSGLSVKIGQSAPDIALNRIDGRPMSLAQATVSSDLVVVNFWATWCQPCRIEMPQLERLYEEYGSQGLQILAVSNENAQVVEEFLAEHPYSFPILIDSEKLISDSYGVTAIPTTVIVNGDGMVLTTRLGVNTSFETQVRMLLETQKRR